jgi:hypothetical protein
VPQPETRSPSAFAEVDVLQLVHNNLSCIHADKISGSAEDVFAAKVKIYLPADHAPAEPSGFSTLYYSFTETPPTDTDCRAAGSSGAAPLETINQTSPPLLNQAKTSQAYFPTRFPTIPSRVFTLSYNYTTLRYSYTTLRHNYTMTTTTRFCFVETPAESDASAGAGAYVTFFAWVCVAVFVFVSRKGEWPPAGARAGDAAPTVKPARAKSVAGLGPMGFRVMLMLALMFLTHGVVSSAEKIGCAENDADCGQTEAAARGSTVLMTPLAGAGAAAELPRRRALQGGGTLCAGHLVGDEGEGGYCSCAEASALIVDGHADLTGYSAINEAAFYGCGQLTSVEFSEGLLTIGFKAFAETSLTSLRLPNSLTDVSGYAFYECQQLASVRFGSGPVTVGDDAFLDTALTVVRISHGATISTYAFDSSVTLCGGPYWLVAEWPDAWFEGEDYVSHDGQSTATACEPCPNDGRPYGATDDDEGAELRGPQCTACDDGTTAVLVGDFTGTCTACPFPSRCLAGLCTTGSEGDGCALCQLYPTRYFQMGQDCEPCPTSVPWLLIVTAIIVAVAIVAVVFKAAEVSDVEDAVEKGAAVAEVVSDGKTVAALGSSMSNLSIHIGIIMPHIQLLGTDLPQSFFHMVPLTN